MSDNKLIKRPYKNYSAEEIELTEQGNYVIQVGSDFFSYDGKVGFTLERAGEFYDDILKDLIEMRKSGSIIEKEDAAKCLLLLKIHPLRIH